MCGIAGIVDYTRRPVAYWAEPLRRLHDAIGHRGPDSSGRVTIEGHRIRATIGLADSAGVLPKPSAATVGLLHTRLAVIDTATRSSQPMPSSDGSTWVAFNGELYNHAALRADLVARGLTLRTRSDTETIVETLAVHGHSCLPQLRGMFAFAWWNGESDTLSLARDPLGIKPLFFCRPHEGVFVFASTPGALMSTQLVERRPTPQGLAEILSRGSLTASTSFWRQIDALSPGTFLTITGRDTVIRKYWSLDRTLLRPQRVQALHTVAAVVEPAIVESVGVHLASDVPVTVLLSGGIDSTAILAGIRQVTQARVDTFTLSMPEASIDEAGAARAIAQHFHTTHHEVRLETIDLEKALDDFFQAMEVPSPGGFNTFLVSRAVKEAGFKVALSGLGGDELLGGYESFSIIAKSIRAHACPDLEARLRRQFQNSPPWRVAKLERLLSDPAIPASQRWWHYRELFSQDDVALLTGGSRGPAAPELPPGANAFAIVRWLEVSRFLQSQLLADADTFSMCHGVELRTPLSDHRLFETVSAAGRWYRKRGHSFKATLFHAMPRLRVPGRIHIVRRKQGFVLPYDTWLRRALAGKAKGPFEDLRRRLDPPRYAPFVRRFLSHELHWTTIWALYVLERLDISDCLGRPELDHRPH
jgi:asparagine synthase (glutamine-hydrolysing)